MIDHYTFGRLIIGSLVYTSDLIIYPDGTIQDAWRRKSGHIVCLADIQKLIELKPQLIIIGRGIPGLMKPDQALLKYLDQNHISYQSLPTRKAVNLFNAQFNNRSVGGCFHLTC